MSDLVVSTGEELADWIELCLLVSESGHLSRDQLNALADEELQLPAHRVSFALNVMSKRSEVLGAHYPFAVNEFAVVRRPGTLADVYAALLCLTPGSVARQTARALDTAEMAELFEDISEVGCANFWGPGGAAVNFGYPSRRGRPQAFDQAVVWLADQMGLEPGSGYRPPRRKDGGVDIVLWRRFADRRSGFPVALAQCTIQADVSVKTGDVDARLWASWLAMDVDPTSILVIPGTVRTEGPDWSLLSTVVTVIERLRLMELVSRGERVPSCEEWVEETIHAVAPHLKAAEH